jgi:outer membrane protein TolC
MRAGKALTFFFLLLFHMTAQSQQSGLPQFISCLIQYQSQTETQRVARALASEEELAVKRRPEITSTIESHDDLINGKKNPNNPQWSVSLNQNLFSYADSKEKEAQSQIVKSETELTKYDVLQGTLGLVDLLMNYISSTGRVQILKTQVESQKKTFNILKEMVKARIVDGSQMLMAESDLMQSQVLLKDSELEVENLEKNLKILPFYQAIKFQNFSQIESFFAKSEVEPLKVDQRPEVKALEYSLKANQSLYLKESRTWIPKLDASITYAQALDNPQALPYREQMIGALTLTIPLSDSVYHSNRASLYKSEVNRIEVLSDRTKSGLKVTIENQKKTLAAAKEQLIVLSEAISSLRKAKEILQKKLQLNKVNYIEFAGIEDRINQMNTIELEKKISIWKMMALWESEKRIALRSTEINGCQ